VFRMATVGTDLFAARNDGLFKRSTATVSVVDGRPGGLRLALAGAQPVVDHIRLRFDLPRSGDATIEVFDVAGRRAARLMRTSLAAGPHELAFDVRPLTPGVYAVRLVAGPQSDVVRLVRAQ